MARNRVTAWRESLTYLLVGIALIFVGLVPAGASAGGLVMPDLIYCLTMGWVMRRPGTVPVYLIVLLSLLADFLLSRPIGLWTLFILLASEYFRGRETGKGLQMRLIEWGSVALAFAIMLLGYKLVSAISFAPVPDIRQFALHFGLTVLAYPLCVAFMYWILNIRAPLPADRSRSIGRVT